MVVSCRGGHFYRRCGDNSMSWLMFRQALRLGLAEAPYRWLAAGLFAVAGVVYAFTLPAAYTGGYVGLVSLRHLTPTLFVFSVALAALVSLAVTLNVFAWRSSLRTKAMVFTFGAFAASFLPASICCTPLLPTLLAVLGASTPQIFGLSGRIQGLVAVYEPLFLSAAVLLLVFALHLSARNVAGACALPARKESSHERTNQQVSE